MNRLVVDTSVVAYILKKSAVAPRYWEILKGNLLGISFVTAAELYRWPLERDWNERRITSLRQHLRGYAVLPYDDVLCWAWARIKSQKRRPLTSADAWVAATAIRYDATLVTHNPHRFEGLPALQVLTI